MLIPIILINFLLQYVNIIGVTKQIILSYSALISVYLIKYLENTIK